MSKMYVIFLGLVIAACGSSPMYKGWDGDPNIRPAAPWGGASGLSTAPSIPGPFLRCARFDNVCQKDITGKTQAWSGNRTMPGSAQRDPTSCVSIQTVTNEPTECCTPLGTCEQNKMPGLCATGQTFVLNCGVNDEIALKYNCAAVPNGGIPYPALCCYL